ncbi:MAG: bile acid:sodium symporter family protein, partial [Planctomycetota bacterium]
MSFPVALLGRHFWIIAWAALLCGALFPWPLPGGRQAMPVLLACVLFFTCLKVSFVRIGRELAVWPRILALAALKLLVLPLPVFLLAWWLAPDWAPGLFLLAAMPAGMTSGAFADVQRGNVALALALILVTSALAPFTVPPLLGVAGQLTGVATRGADIAVMAAQAAFLAGMLLAPLTLAQFVRWRWPGWIERKRAGFTTIALGCNAVLLFVATVAARDRLAALAVDPRRLVTLPLIGVVLVSAVFLVCGRLLRIWLAPADAVAFTCNAVYMNNGLGMVFAMAFFPEDPRLMLPSLLMAVPMTFTVCLVGRLVGRLDGPPA